MDHSFDYHAHCMHGLCRICGKRVLSKQEKRKHFKKIKCVDFRHELLLYFDINIDTDSELVHSTYMCYRCKKSLHYLQNSGGVLSLQNARKLKCESESLWTAYNPQFTISQCSLCFRHEDLGTGCAVKKRQHLHRLTWMHQNQ